MTTNIPIRMRGYYRAVKRKEPWALKIAKYPQGSLDWMFAYYFRGVCVQELMVDRPSLFDSAPKDTWQGGYITVPLKP